jgi:hypothetical protein
MSNSNSRLLGVIIALQGLILAGQWVGSGYGNYANAQLQTDPGRDRQALIDELRASNVKLDRMNDFLASGKLQVHVIQPDENKGKPTGR